MVKALIVAGMASLAFVSIATMNEFAIVPRATTLAAQKCMTLDDVVDSYGDRGLVTRTLAAPVLLFVVADMPTKC